MRSASSPIRRRPRSSQGTGTRSCSRPSRSWAGRWSASRSRSAISSEPSSAKRFVFERALGVAAYATRTMADILDGLEVDPDRMRANLEATGGMIFSEAILLALVAKGAERQDAYRLVQALARGAWRGERTFRDAVLTDPGIAEWLSTEELERAMDLDHHLEGIGVTYRALGLDDGDPTPASATASGSSPDATG